MAKRIVCCPGSGDRLEYLYVDTACLLVENITDKVSVLVSDAGSRCCFDALAGYALGEKVLSEEEADLFSFDFYGLHSFELFRDKEELRLKTGSDKILHSCLLNYYRREYDGTQQHTFFAEPTVGNTYVRVSGGVEHELTLENRELVKNKAEEESELETLDKGKSQAEREAEAAKAQAELAEQEARADAEAKAEKAEKKDKARKKHQRLMEEERYREFRNQDNVQTEEYQRFRRYEEEMRHNNAALTAEYNQGNYASLPGYIAPTEFAGTYETNGSETLGVAIDNVDLYSLASRFDEFEVPYTVGGETLADGRQISCIYYSSDYADRASSAKDFYELERSLHFDEVVTGQTYYNAFQLSALEYAYENNVDTFYVANGEYNGNQMFRILDAGLNGYDMATVANPAYTPAHMDALCYYMSYGWDTRTISDPAMAPLDIADRVMQEEFRNGVSHENSFFSTHDYNGFLSYPSVTAASSYFNDYDNAQQQKFFAQQGQRAAQAEAQADYDAFKENLHSGYAQRQAEMHYLGYNSEASPVSVNAAGPSAAVDALCKYIDPDTGVEKTIPRSQVTPELVVRCEKYWSERVGVSHPPLSGGGNIPYNVLNDKHALAGAGQARYTPNGYVRSDSSFAPYAGGKSAAVLQGAATLTHGKTGTVDPGAGHKTGTGKQEVVVAGAGEKQSPVPKVRYNVGPTGGPNGPNGPDGGPRSGPRSQVPVSNKMPGQKHRALDDLKVRSNFARRAGLKIQTYGGKCVSVATYSARHAFSKVGYAITQNDETGTVSAMHSMKRVAGNTVLVAQLVGDVPRQFMRAGQGISYAGNAVKNLDRRICGEKPVALKQKTISAKQVQKEYVSLQKNQFNEIRKKYGADAAKMNLREINGNIKRLDGKKNALIKENQALKKEIRGLYDKKGLSKSERALLKDKLDLKKKNDALIKKHFADIKKLNELKGLKKGDAKALKALRGKQKNFAGKDGRWRSARGVFLQSLISQLQRAGADNTMGGMATASRFVMSYMRSPISRVVRGAVSSLVVRPVKFVVKKTIVQPTTKLVKKVVRNSKAYKNLRAKRISANRKRAQRVDNRKALKKKVETKVNNRLEKTFGKKTMDTAKKLMRGGKKTGSVVGKVIGAPFKAIGKAFAGIGHAFGFLKKIIMQAAIGILAAYLVLTILASLISSAASTISSVFPGSSDSEEETEDGRIQMSHYVDILNNCQNDLQKQINNIAAGESSSGQEYDNVFYDFNGVQGNNAAQILAMTAVRFEWDLDTYSSSVDKYIKQLYADSNYFDYVESDAYFCDNGCVERHYKCYDKPDEYATETRKSLYKASNHSDEKWVGKGKEHGCVASKPYSCMTIGHGTYNLNGCKKHNDGKAMSEPCSCGNYEDKSTSKTTVAYYCPGYYMHMAGRDELMKHGGGAAMENPCSCDGCERVETVIVTPKYYCKGYCHGKHVDYSCSGHTERVCYGKHRDITFTITSLGFDDIFVVDSLVAAQGASVRGEAYKDKFVISAYCSCHKCCHVTQSGKVLCKGEGTTDCKQRIQNAKTSSGVSPMAKHTLAVDADNPVVPMGTHVWIDGIEYVVEDKGAMAANGKDFDMYFDSHEAALRWGVRTKTVYKNKNKESSDGGSNPSGFPAFDGWNEDNHGFALNVYNSFVGEEAKELYVGMDKVVDVSYGIKMDTAYDFGDIEFDDVTGLTNRQKQVLAVIDSNSIATVKGRCQAWVADVYQAALGGQRNSKCCANHAGEAWGVSNDWSKIQVGATVYGYSSSKYGHVGIYIGNGMVAHNIGYLKVQSLESWLNTYNGKCWGWNGGVNLTSKSEYNCKTPGSFMQGKD